MGLSRFGASGDGFIDRPIIPPFPRPGQGERPAFKKCSLGTFAPDTVAGRRSRVALLLVLSVVEDSSSTYYRECLQKLCLGFCRAHQECPSYYPKSPSPQHCRIPCKSKLPRRPLIRLNTCLTSKGKGMNFVLNAIPYNPTYLPKPNPRRGLDEIPFRGLQSKMIFDKLD